jgi:MFS family permease
MGAGVASPALVRRAAWAVVAVFATNGFMFANWASRIPAARDALDLTPSRLGLVLLAASVGALIGLPLSGLVVERLGARRALGTFASVGTLGLSVIGAGIALPSVLVLAIGLVLTGLGSGVWDAAMNLEGGVVERLHGRSLMPRFHAGFSFGTMAGSGTGALASWAGIPFGLHLVLAAAVTLAAALVAVRSFLPNAAAGRIDPPTSPSARAQGRRALATWRESRTLLVGVLVFAAALTEGAANDWLSISVVDGFRTKEAVGALGFGLFVTAMTAMRLAGTALLDRHGRIAVLRLVAALALVGLLIFGLAPNLPMALIGVALWGAGAALGFPVGMSAASDDPALAPMRISVVATIGYAAFLAGPPLLGFLAAQVGYRHALLALAIPIALGLVVVRAAAPLEPAAATTTLGE